MGDDLRVVGEGTLAAAQRWKARAETAEAERDENQRAEADCNAALLLLDEYEGVLEDRVRAVLAERDKQNYALRDRHGVIQSPREWKMRAESAEELLRELRAERDKLREALSECADAITTVAGTMDYYFGPNARSLASRENVDGFRRIIAARDSARALASNTTTPEESDGAE